MSEGEGEGGRERERESNVCIFRLRLHGKPIGLKLLLWDQCGSSTSFVKIERSSLRVECRMDLALHL